VCASASTRGSRWRRSATCSGRRCSGWRASCSHAQPGQIIVPEGVRHLVAGKGFLFSDIGEVTLRGFEDPVRLYEVRWEG